VYYIEVVDGERTVRAKYAVVSMADFARYTSERAFQAYFWGRFAQPCALLYAADPAAAQAATAAVSSAVITFIRTALPLVPPRAPIETLWITQLTYSYQAELRAERQAVPARLYANAPERYERVTRAALPHLPFAATAETCDGKMWITAQVPDGTRAVAHGRW